MSPSGLRDGDGRRSSCWRRRSTSGFAGWRSPMLRLWESCFLRSRRTTTNSSGCLWQRASVRAGGVFYAESGRVLRCLPGGIAWPLLPACRRGAELTVHPSGPGPRPRRTCLSTDSHLAVYKDCFWVFGVVIRTNLIALHGLTPHSRGRRGTRRRTCRRAIDVLLVQR